MNRKAVSWIVIGIIIVAVIVVGVVAYWAYTNTGGGEEGPTPTPTATSPVEGATSIGLKVNATINGANEEYAFTAKNLGTSDIQLLVDEIDAQGNVFVYLYNQTAQTLWISVSGQWMDQSTDFTSYWSGANSAIIGDTALNSYMTELANWSGSGDYSYTSNGNSYRIFDIIVNPPAADIDPLFVHG